jgi:hypothetical protein
MVKYTTKISGMCLRFGPPNLKLEQQQLKDEKVGDCKEKDKIMVGK